MKANELHHVIAQLLGEVREPIAGDNKPPRAIASACDTVQRDTTL